MNKVMVKVANDNKDFTGYDNWWCSENVEDVARMVLYLVCDNPYHLARTYAVHRMSGEDKYAQYRS